MSPRSALVRTFLQHHVLTVIGATAAALLVGLASTAVVSLVGPCFQLLLSSENTAQFRLSELFGNNWRLLAPFLPSAFYSREQLFFYLPLVLVGIATCKALFYIVQNSIWERLGERLGQELRQRLVTAYITLDPSARGQKPAQAHEAQLASLVAGDIKLLRDYLVHFYGGLPRELLQILFMSTTLLLLSPKLTVLFVVGLAPAIVVIDRLGKKLRRRTSAALNNYSELSEWVQGRLLGVETIKHYRTETLENKKFSQLTEELFRRYLNAARIKARTSPFLEALGIISLVIVLTFALQELNAGTLTSASAVSFFAALALLCQSIATVGRYINSNREGAAAAERVQQTLHFFNAATLSQLAFPADRASDANLAIVCEEVSAGYPDNDDVVREFSWRLFRGKIYAIVGPSGAGKTTLGRIILGLQQPSRGLVRYNATMLSEHPIPVGYVPQKIQLLDGSIAENLSYPYAPPADESPLWAALEGVGLAEFTRSLPDGLATRVGSRGHGLSGGQEQRLYLARIGFHRFPVTVIDEGTAALDLTSEDLVCTYLTMLRNTGMTFVVITHRSSLTRIADEVITLGPKA